uniref:Dopey-1 n=1 Tax=Daphnia magna TaxID=35525 RepID=A0A0P5JMF4_9CRUS
MSHLSLEELELIDEPKYRNYINSVDKALKNFEYTSEWADLIAALGKLNKVLQNHSKFNIIPRRVIVAKRLAQCLHPALPSGVHLKALETYDLIFKLVGAARLSNELFIYSAGLYPLLAHAAINVRPVLLSLYEIHLIPIAEYLKPGLSGFLNGVLPGLEEGADHYDRTSTLFDKICNGVSANFFYGCLWKCIAENPQIRLPAYTYILSHFDRKLSIEDQLEILGQNIDLMIHSMCASLEDSSVLVQRSALEFLLAAFPLHGSHLLKPDVVHLLAAAITALLRRDMSLNRRLFSWLLGSEPQLLSADDSLVNDTLRDSPNVKSYFHRYSKSLLVESLQLVLKNSAAAKPPDMKPYRVLISLLDKPEIGPIILDDILIDVFRSLYFSNNDQSKKQKKAAQHDELVKTANLFFGTLEEAYIWSYTGRLLQKSSCIETASREVQQVGQGSPHFFEMCKLSAFLLELLSVDSSSDTQVEHLPSLLVQTADLLHASFGAMSAASVLAGIELCLTLLKKILPAHEGTEELAGSWSSPSEGEEAIESSSGEFHSPPSSPALISSSQHQKQLLEHAVVAIQQLLAKLLNPGIFVSDRTTLLKQASNILSVQTVSCTPPLEEMLEECVNPSTSSYLTLAKPSSVSEEMYELDLSKELKLADADQLAQLLPVLKKCCTLLKELSAFPTYCAAAMASHQVISNNQDWITLPDWLQLLCLVSCCLSNSSSQSNQIYLIGTATLLDLTAITSSIIPTAYWKPEQTTNLQKGDIPSDMFTVVLLPVITPTQLLTLLNKSCVFQRMARQLWEGVGSTFECQRCAELIHQLHTLAPPTLSHVAEDVILSSLSQQMRRNEGCSSAVEKFTVLWHLGRDLEPSRWGSRRLKTFDRCLQLLLDWLSLDPPSPQRTAAEGWFVQALLRNDLSRILDPLLLKLLKPHSARVSIRHVTFQPTNQENEKQPVDREDNIYAISSVNGHVIYHVTPSRTKSRPFSPSRSVLTLGLGADGRAPESFVDRQVVFPWQLPQHQIMEQTVGLFVNPFSEDLFHVPNAFTTSATSTDSGQESPKEPESSVVAKSLLDELIETVVNKAVAAAAAARFKLKESATVAAEKLADIHPLHNHILLYCQVSDAEQTLHVLRTLRSQLQLQPRLLLLSLSSTGIASSRSPHSVLLQELLARHRKCLFGNGFYGEVSGDMMAPNRSSMYLEILLQLLLYHLRTYYSSLGMSSLTRQEIISNRQVQLACVQLLNMFLSELLPLVRDLGKGFSSFISDMLTRCRVQKVALHSILAMLHVVTLDHNKPVKKRNGNPGLLPTLTEEIILFNEEDEKSGSSYSEATLISLVKLLLSIMAIEDQLSKQNSPAGDLPSVNVAASSPASVPGTYQRGVPVHSQPLFTTAILTALKQKSSRWLHTEFSRLLVSSLPLMGRSLPTLLNAVVPQVCLNLESIAASSTQHLICPPDYLITELEALTALCHFVLVDSPHNAGGPTLAGSAGMLGGMSWGVSNVYASGTPPNPNGQILNNLMHAFTPNGINGTLGNESTSAGGDPYLVARRQMLSSLPRILVCISYLWQSSIDRLTGKVQRQKLLEFVSPIGHHHGVSLLAAVSVAWVEKRKDSMTGNGKSKKIIPECGSEQLALVDLISSVRVLPPDTLVQLLRQVLKQPLQMQLHNRSSRLEVGLLHFFHAYLQKINRVQLGECWGSLLQLLREVTTMAPPILFAGLVVFGEAVQRYQTPGEKRDQRELQEVTGKLLEACGAVAAASLEQTTWLRRNLSVRRDTLSAAPTAESDDAAILDEMSSSSSDTSSVHMSATDDAAVVVNPSSNNKTSRYSIQALVVLAELLAPLQDLIFPSQDKERVIPLLTSLLANVVPYLRHHSQSNISGMRAASLLLSSLSDYPATRRAWRKDAFDLLLDPTFFMMDIETLRHWKNIIDNLMCHDKDAFREFLNRVSVSPSGLFSSRELEMETRTLFLKRLAFTLFCTDGDQYQRFLPDIQEKLSESLRLAQSWPSVQAQVFLCFRVLLLKTSQQHVTSLWPSVVAETVQVLSQLEHELRRDTEEFRHWNRYIVVTVECSYWLYTISETFA